MHLLERETQLALLSAALDEVHSGTGRISLVYGEAGIGKSSLVRQFIQAQAGRFEVLWAACDPQFAPRPLSLLFDIARQSRPDLLPLLERSADWLSVASALLADLERAPAPIIVVFEDVHWADEATFDLLKYIARRIQSTRTLMILTYREDEIDTAHPLRMALSSLPGPPLVRRIGLPALSPQAVAHLVQGLKVDPVELHRLTGGNPFYITEVLEGDGGVPPTVRDAVLARVARLSPAGRRTLEAAAIIGSRLEAWLLAEIAGEEADTAGSITAGILHTQTDRAHIGPAPASLAADNWLAFRHDLAWQAISEAIPPERRLALHRRALAALRASPLTHSDWARLAYHAEAAAEPQAVMEYAPAAARQAAAASAHRQAAAQYARVMRFAGDLPSSQRAELLDQFSDELVLVDRLDEAIQAIQEAIRLWSELENRHREGRSLSILSLYLIRAGRNAEGEQASRRAIEILSALPPSPELATAYRTRAGLRMLDRDHERAIYWGEKAMEMAERFQSLEDLASAYNVVGSSLILTGDERGREYLERCIALSRQTGFDHGASLGYTNLASAYGEIYRFDDADRYLQAGMAFCVEHELDQAHTYMLSWQALSHLYRGRWDQAAEAAHQVLQRPYASAISRIMASAALGRLRARRGDPGALAVLDEALDLAQQTATLQRLAPVHAARAEAAWLAGDRVRCGQEAQTVYEMAVERRHAWFAGELAVWQRLAGFDVTPPQWIAAPFAREIEGDWRAAAAEWERLGCPFEQARLLAGGDVPARLAALSIFERLGAVPAIEALRRDLRSQRVRGVPRGPRPSTRSNPSGLTRRELDVLALVATGLSNAEIAEHLSLSVRTVEHHVSALLAKLQVRTRAEAIAQAFQSGLLEAC